MVKKLLQSAINKVWYAAHPNHTKSVDVDSLTPYSYAGQQQNSPWENSIFDGSKFSGGFGATQLYDLDYWTLRERSAQLFRENLYAKGLLRRLVTNEINTGLTPEACPDSEILQMSEDSLNDWTDLVENRFHIWGKDPKLCDQKQQMTFGAIQRAARLEAYIEGDILVVLTQSRRTRLPVVQLVSGSKVQTPMTGEFRLKSGHEIKHGVEIDKQGRVVAHWVRQKDSTSKRIPAFGEKTGRRISWLVYGVDKRLDDIRGEPILSVVLQSLKEIDRYRDSVQRKAVVNSILAMFIEKSEDKPGTLPISGGATRKDSVQVSDGDGTSRNFNIANQIPGLVIEELQTGEKPVGFHSQGTDINFGTFEEAIIQSVAWANEVPPEILRLAFSNNYSASQAAINEFKIYLNKVWMDWGETFCTPIYVEWMLSETFLQKITVPGFVESWRDPQQYDTFGAWTLVDWNGSIKPSTDIVKQGKGSKLYVDEGWSTNAREARINTGTKFSKNIKRLKRENELKVEAARPLAEFKKEFNETPDQTFEALNGFEELDPLLEDFLKNKEALGE